MLWCWTSWHAPNAANTVAGALTQQSPVDKRPDISYLARFSHTVGLPVYGPHELSSHCFWPVGCPLRIRAGKLALTDRSSAYDVE